MAPLSITPLSFWRNMVLFGVFGCGKNVISQALSKVVSWLLCCHGCGKIFVYIFFLVPSLYRLLSLKMSAVLQFWSSGLCGMWGKRKWDVWCSHIWISPNWQWHCLTWCEQWSRLNSMASSSWSLSYSRWVGADREEEGAAQGHDGAATGSAILPALVLRERREDGSRRRRRYPTMGRENGEREGSFFFFFEGRPLWLSLLRFKTELHHPRVWVWHNLEDR